MPTESGVLQQERTHRQQVAMSAGPCSGRPYPRTRGMDGGNGLNTVKTPCYGQLNHPSKTANVDSISIRIINAWRIQRVWSSVPTDVKKLKEFCRPYTR